MGCLSLWLIFSAFKLEKKNNFVRVMDACCILSFPVTCSLMKIRNIEILFMVIVGRERKFTSQWGNTDSFR